MNKDENMPNWILFICSKIFDSNGEKYMCLLQLKKMVNEKFKTKALSMSLKIC